MDNIEYLKFVLVLIFVLGLIGLFAFLLRRLGVGGIRHRAPYGRIRRLSIQDVLTIDARRRLVLVRRDDTDHLILLGQTNDLLIESGIPAPPEPEPPASDGSGDNGVGGGAGGAGSFKRMLAGLRNRSG